MLAMNGSLKSGMKFMGIYGIMITKSFYVLAVICQMLRRLPMFAVFVPVFECVRIRDTLGLPGAAPAPRRATRRKSEPEYKTSDEEER